MCGRHVCVRARRAWKPHSSQAELHFEAHLTILGIELNEGRKEDEKKEKLIAAKPIMDGVEVC